MGFSSVLSQSRVILVLLSTFRTFTFLRKMLSFDVYLSTGFGIKSFEAMLKAELKNLIYGIFVTNVTKFSTYVG